MSFKLTIIGAGSLTFARTLFSDIMHVPELRGIEVAFTDISQEMQEKYRALVDIPQALQFREVEHAYNDLYALFMAVSKAEGLEFTSMGVDVVENRVDVGLPDIAGEAEARALILEQLPDDITARFDDLPLFFQEEEYGTTS